MIEVRLYDDNLSSPTFKEDLTYRVEKLKFSTILNGGFDKCSFRLKDSLFNAWEWLSRRMFWRIVISDIEKNLFEGRIQDISVEMGFFDITAYGYYANLKDIPYATAYNDVASTIIKAVLTANCSQISSDQTNIDTTDITITSAADSTYLDIYPDQLIEKLLAFSDSSANKYYFAIWEDRVPYLFARSVSSLDWQVDLNNLTSFKLRHSGSQLWNAAYAVYLVAGAITRTADQDDTDSQSKYFERKYLVRNLGEVAAATAQAQRDLIVEENKEIYPYLENITLGDQVLNSNGVPYQSYWVRAGEVIRIRDLVPTSVDTGTVTRDALRTYYIIGTEYNADTKENRLILDTEPGDIVNQLSLKLKSLELLKNKT